MSNRLLGSTLGLGLVLVLGHKACEMDQVKKTESNEITASMSPARETFRRTFGDSPLAGEPLDQAAREESFHNQALEIQEILVANGRNFEYKVDEHGYAHLIYRESGMIAAISLPDEYHLDKEQVYNVALELYGPNQQGRVEQQATFFYSGETAKSIIADMSTSLPEPSVK